MLERIHGHDNSLKEKISSLPCEIILPFSMDSFFKQEERLTCDDRRKMPRLVFHAEAALEHPRESLMNRKPGWIKVYIRDLSRGGIGFIHSEQLFPMEKFKLLFPMPKSVALGTFKQPVQIEIVRCKRHSDKCYEIGAMMLDATGQKALSILS